MKKKSCLNIHFLATASLLLNVKNELNNLKNTFMLLHFIINSAVQAAVFYFYPFKFLPHAFTLQ